MKKWKIVISIFCVMFMLSACSLSSPSPNLDGFTEQPAGDTPTPQEATEPKNTMDEPTSEKESISPAEFIQRFQLHNYTFIYEHMTDELREHISVEEFIQLSEPFNQGVTSYQLEGKLPMDGSYKYSWIDNSGTKSVSIYLNEDNQIAGLWIYPVITYPETDQILSTIEYSLPFKGEWFTYWGGMNEIVNYHYSFPEQRYAYDFLILIDEISHEEDINSNESYYAFGEGVYAPADGVVVAIENSIEDNKPGEMNPYQPLGNYIVIDHGHGEYSLLAHLQQGSVQVEIGDSVRRGDWLARCGNSGNSSEPHIHFQVMDHPDIEDAISINPRFLEYEQIVQGDYVIGN